MIIYIGNKELRQRIKEGERLNIQNLMHQREVICQKNIRIKTLEEEVERLKKHSLNVLDKNLDELL